MNIFCLQLILAYEPNFCNAALTAILFLSYKMTSDIMGSWLVLNLPLKAEQSLVKSADERALNFAFL